MKKKWRKWKIKVKIDLQKNQKWRKWRKWRKLCMKLNKKHHKIIKLQNGEQNGESFCMKLNKKHHKIIKLQNGEHKNGESTNMAMTINQEIS